MSFSKAEPASTVLKMVVDYGWDRMLVLFICTTWFIIILLSANRLKSRHELMFPLLTLCLIILIDAVSLFFRVKLRSLNEALFVAMVSINLPFTDMLAVITTMIVSVATLSKASLRASTWMGLISSVAHILVAPLVVYASS